MYTYVPFVPILTDKFITRKPPIWDGGRDGGEGRAGGGVNRDRKGGGGEGSKC